MNDRRKEIIQTYMGKMVNVVVDRPIGFVHNNITYTLNYGYIPDTIAADGEEQDVYIVGVDIPLDTFSGRVIGAVCRKDDCEDKLVVAPDGILLHQGQIADAVYFQEKYFDTYIISAFQKSCGVLPYRITKAGTEVLIVFEEYSQCWSIPKGHMEAGESEHEAALRELYEETTLTTTLNNGEAAVIEYMLSPIIRKQVVIFLGQVCGTPCARQGEIKQCRWVKADELSQYLHKDTAEACMKLLKKLPG